MPLVRRPDPTDDGPRFLYLSDGRLLTWFHTAGADGAPERVEGFQLTRDEWVGVQPITIAEGLSVLAAECRQRDGRLHEPVAEPRINAATRRVRPHRSRRF